MAYKDELGILLDEMVREDLQELAIEYLKESKNEVHSKTTPELRMLCSSSLRNAGGHSLTNLFRDAHELPYRTIVEDVAKFMKVTITKDDDVKMIEQRVLSAVVAKAWDKLSDEKKGELVKKIQREVAKTHIGIKDELSVQMLGALIKEGFAPTALAGTAGVGVLSAGAFATTVGSVVGLTVIQTIVFQAILSYVGYVAAAQALLGIGVWGGVLAAASWAGPIGVALGGAYAAHKVADTAFRKTIPSVLFLAQKRRELFGKTQFSEQ